MAPATVRRPRHRDKLPARAADGLPAMAARNTHFGPMPAAMAPPAAAVQPENVCKSDRARQLCLARPGAPPRGHVRAVLPAHAVARGHGWLGVRPARAMAGGRAHQPASALARIIAEQLGAKARNSGIWPAGCRLRRATGAYLVCQTAGATRAAGGATLASARMSDGARR